MKRNKNAVLEKFIEEIFDSLNKMNLEIESFDLELTINEKYDNLSTITYKMRT